MKKYLESIIKRDPAARNIIYVILTYPGVKAVFFHFISRKLWKLYTLYSNILNGIITLHGK